MSALTTFNGVTLGGIANCPTIINQSDKPVMGYALQRHTTIGYNPVFVVIDLAGNPVQPGEERPLWLFNGFRSVSLAGKCGSLSGNEEEETISYELKAVLFADGTFYGLDSIFQDFSSRISMTRSLARDTQYTTNKYDMLEQYRGAALLKAMRTTASTQEALALELRNILAHVILGIRDSKGEQEAEAALARIAALPDVVRGGQSPQD